MKRVLCTLVAIVIILSNIICQAKEEVYFKDLDPNHWAYQHIINVYNKGLINGYPDKTIRPEEFVTRGEFCKMLLNAAGLEAYEMENPTGHWAYPYMVTLRDCTWSYEDWYLKEIKPDVIINRGEASMGMADIYLGHPYAIVGGIDCYNDKENIGGYHECVAIVTRYGIMNGYEDGCFHPEYSIRRSEMCAMMDRAFGYLAEGEIYNSSQVYFRNR